MTSSGHGGDIYRNRNVRIDMSKSINPLGMPANVKEALIAGVDLFVNYPDERCEELREAIARKEGVPPGWIVCGNGASELIHAVCRAVRPATGKVFDPTFSEYRTALELTGCSVDSPAERPDIMFVCTPNNPTGEIIPPDGLEELSGRCGTLVVDECFIEFTGRESLTGRIARLPNVVVLKAFTKIYSMAGLRLGYAISSGDGMTGMISRQLPSWNVSVPAQIAGLAALENDGWIERTAAYVAGERDFLTSRMAPLVRILGSAANFIFFETEKPVYGHMLSCGILIRRWDATRYRIAVGTREDNEEFIRCLEMM